MNGETMRLPSPTRQAAGAVALLGVAALLAVDPTVGVGILSGAAIATAARGTGRLSNPSVATAAVTLGAFAWVASVGVAAASGLGGVFLALPAVVVGVGLVATVAGGVTTANLKATGGRALYGSLLAAVATVATVFLDAAGTLDDAVAGLFWLPRQGVVGAGVTTLVAAGSVVLGLHILPRAVFVPPRRGESVAREVRNGFTTAAGAGICLVSAGLWYAASALGSIVPALRVVYPAFLLSVILVGTTTTALGVLLTKAWSSPGDRGTNVISTFAGAVAGAVVPLVAVIGAGFPRSFPYEVRAWFGFTAALLFLAGVTARWYAGVSSGDLLAKTPRLYAIGVVVIAVASEALATLEGAPVGASTRGLATLVAVAAALYVYRVGCYGQTLSAEVGPADATQRPQAIRLGWLGAVAVAGLLVAVVALWVVSVIAPTLSVPATLGTVGGLVALVAAVLLLLK